MLPYYTTKLHLIKFFNLIKDPKKAILLCESKQSYINFESLHNDFNPYLIFMGLNDLHIDLNLSFMFEILLDPLFELISKKIIGKSYFGFGGISNLNGGLIKGEYIALEHKFFNSDFVILSRSFFKNVSINESYHNLLDIQKIFKEEHKYSTLQSNHNNIKRIINKEFNKNYK
jgi:hypothetical protein